MAKQPEQKRARQTEDEAFLQVILERPADDATRLIYADWLEERGDARADYLRTQVEFRKSRTEELRRRLIELYPTSIWPGRRCWNRPGPSRPT